MNLLIIHLLWPVITYFMGSIPFGLIIVRWAARLDIRRMGSGNIGATNVRRIAGPGWAAATLICDLLKGLLPTLGAVLMVGTNQHWLPAVTALAAILGHMFPAYLKFKPSGKGVATTLGAFLAMAPWASLIALMVFIFAVRKFRLVSAGSLLAMMALPPGIWFTLHDLTLTASALTAMILIVYRHEDNLRRLARGKEPSLGGDQA